MKKEQKEQVKVMLKDINAAVVSWLTPIKEEQKKLFDLIQDNRNQESNFKDMYFGRIAKEPNYYTQWGENQQYFKLLQVAEKYYHKQLKNICCYINASIHLLTTLMCETKKDFQDLLKMVDYENEEYVFYITFDKRNITFIAHLKDVYESLTSCLYVNEKYYTYNALLDTQLLQEDFKNNNYNFNKLEEKQLLELSNDIEKKRLKVINKLNECLEEININKVMINVCNISQLLRIQEQEKEDLMTKQKQELSKQDNLNIAIYFGN